MAKGNVRGGVSFEGGVSMGGCRFALALVMIVVLLVVGACCAEGQEIEYPWLGNPF